jgi:hypothetical protein
MSTRILKLFMLKDYPSKISKSELNIIYKLSRSFPIKIIYEREVVCGTSKKSLLYISISNFKRAYFFFLE